MYTIEFIYVTTTLLSVLTAFPQLKQLWSIKNSDEFNLFSWVAWLIAQLAALVYAISIASVPYLIVNILWITFYVLMIGLIVKYRGNRRVAYVRVEAAENRDNDSGR
jgi:uncharacterized protein with PQ loop repeat